MENRTDRPDVGLANLRFARALVGELQAAGVVAAVVCPGSRSTPLALAIAEQPRLPHTVHIDERSAAFHALGFAKASGRPVALLCTSGTAAANFLPAVAEAHHARVPLVLLTADRPPELRSWGAAQTLDQRALFAGFTRWFEETPCPGERDDELAYAVAVARRAVCEAAGPAPGPVHLNLPFREPLAPAKIEPRGPVAGLAPEACPQGVAPAVLEVDAVTADLRGVARGVLLFGPDAWDASLATVAHSLAESLGWPVLADPASGLRAGAPLTHGIVHGADLLLRDAAASAALRPDLIVRFGGQPTSTSIGRWMKQHSSAQVWLVDQAAGFRDPQHRAARMFRLTPREFCHGLARRSAAAAPAALAWRTQWQQAERIAWNAVAAALDAEPAFLTPHLSRMLWARLPEGAILYAANSMAIRELDTFAGPRAAALRLLANRGVNGIDGLLSSALGAAAATPAPTALWCGDLAFLHDVAGLLAGRLLNANLTVVVSHDDGGGIFEYLPATQAIERTQFERLFAVAHGTDLCAVARGFGWQAVQAGSAAAFAEALPRALAGGLHVIEVPVERGVNTAFHTRLDGIIAVALQREGKP